MSEKLSRSGGAFFDATTVVHGVAAARFANDSKSVSSMVEDYISLRVKEGTAIEEAWSTLFGAAVVAFCDELEARGADEHVIPSTALSQRAVAHALSLDLT